MMIMNPVDQEINANKKSKIKILEEKDKSLLISNPPNFFKLNTCFEYANKQGKLNPTNKIDL
jgi:hypothetical protein